MSEALCLARKGKIERQVETLIDNAKRLNNSQWAVGSDLPCQRLCPDHQLISRNNLVDKADPQRLVRVDNRAREQELKRRTAAHETSQPLRATVARNHAQFHLRLTQVCIV